MDIKLSVIIKCYQDIRILDCLESIYERCEIIVPYAGNSFIAKTIVDKYPQVRIIKVPKGNLSKSCNRGIHVCTNNSVIIMDSDSKFKPGSLSLIYKFLQNHLVVKPRIVYEHDKSVAGSRLVAETRQQFNDQEIRALTPGLAFRKEILSHIGYDDYFDERVCFTEDAILDWRLRRAGVKIKFIPEAIVFHAPTSIYHDLRAAFRMGYGHYTGIKYAGRENDYRIKDVIRRVLFGSYFKSCYKAGVKYGSSFALYSITWDFLYQIGFIKEWGRLMLNKSSI